jgi:hypothetical protein
MLYQPFNFVLRVNIMIFNDKIKDEGLIRRDENLPIRAMRSVIGKENRKRKSVTSNSRIADKRLSLVLP